LGLKMELGRERTRNFLVEKRKKLSVLLRKYGTHRAHKGKKKNQIQPDSLSGRRGGGISCAGRAGEGRKERG